MRAAVVWSEVTVKLAREHNDANVICLGARLIEPALAETYCNSFDNSI
ncbi:MAG: RpiB/LacA/LacB family sugar-phosphate isomerase [Bdellovibrionales bacterium]|nr:RpiB/LacA/LacB family sugar-phosphate isomerase [Bdellovibrionales bacterium]